MGIWESFKWKCQEIVWDVQYKVETIFDGIKGVFSSEIKESANKTSTKKAYNNEKATSAEVQDINQALTNLSFKIAKKADELEEILIKKSEWGLYEMIKFLKEENEKIPLNFERLESKIEELHWKNDGIIKNHLAKRISLDDRECLELLKLNPEEKIVREGKKYNSNKKTGYKQIKSKKQRRIEEFEVKVLKEGIEKLIDNIQETIEAKQEYIRESVKDKLEEIDMVGQEKLKELERIEKNYIEEKITEDKKRSEYVEGIAICDIGFRITNKI